MANAKESQLPIQIIAKNIPVIRESQLPIQIIAKNIPAIRVSQLFVQVLVQKPRQPRIFITS